MKKIFLFGITAMTASVLISSCKKSDPASIAGRWNIVDQIGYQGGVYDTIIATQGDYIDFRSDSKLIIGNNAGPTDSSTYSVNSGKVYLTNLVSAQKDTLQIELLTIAALRLNRRYPDNSGFIVNLSK